MIWMIIRWSRDSIEDAIALSATLIIQNYFRWSS